MRLTKLICALLLVTAILSGCATPEAQLRTGLTRAGLAPPIAACMAERMVDRLSLLQLRRIAGLPKVSDSVSLEQFIVRVRALRDPEILGVASSSGLLCATGIAR